MNRFLISISIALIFSCTKETPLPEEALQPEVYDLSVQQLFTMVDSVGILNEPMLFESAAGDSLELVPSLYRIEEANGSCDNRSHTSDMIVAFYENTEKDVTIPIYLYSYLVNGSEDDGCYTGYSLRAGLKATSGAQELILSFYSLSDFARIPIRFPDGTIIPFDSSLLPYSFEDEIELNGTIYLEVYKREIDGGGPHSLFYWSPRSGVVAFADREGTRWYRL